MGHLQVVNKSKKSLKTESVLQNYEHVGGV